jgi:DNA helicase-2/ATP-dependent DNA helicase PcrA
MANNIIWSEYQKNIFKDINEGIGNTIILARAGASKTTVLVEGVKYIPKKKKALFVAFNTRIAEELDERINKSYITVKTIHSFGCRMIMNKFGKIKIDPLKTENLIKNILTEMGYKKFEKEKYNILASLLKITNLCKGSLIDIPSKMDELIDRYDIETYDMDRDEFVKTVCKILKACKASIDCIDFSDMIWFPFVYGLSCPTFDLVFIDECQDLNAAQVHIALLACKKGGRVIACGDDKQVLYSFTGVEIDAIDRLKKRLNAKVLPLPISYRCAKSIVKEAQKIVPDIQSAPNAIEGMVKNIPESIFLSFVKPGDFILSRLNAPLIYYCMELIRKKIPANVAGRDVGNNLAWMIKKSEMKTVPSFLDWLEKWKQSEVKRLKEKNRDPILVLDKAECLVNLCRDAKDLDEVKSNIKELFKDNEDQKIVWLMSVHKAKGLEADRCFLLMDTFRDHTGDPSEVNIKYVAVSRAKDTLFKVIQS